MSIAKNCMIVNVCIGTWTGHRFDSSASKQVTAAANADDDAARVSKRLVPKTALDPIIAVAAAIRKHLYTSTLPWKDNGDRLLPRTMYTAFIEEHEAKVSTYKRCVEEFLTQLYPQARAQAEFRMGSLFRAADYPDVDQLRAKFYVQLDIDPVTEANDFRVTMDEDNLQSIRQSIEQATGERISRAMVDVWQRLADTLGHFTEKMSTDAIFRDATVHNLHEIVRVLPQLNITGDANLAKICQDIEATILPYTARDLRKDTSVKQAAASEAKRIMDDMRGFMAAFGGQ